MINKLNFEIAKRRKSQMIWSFGCALLLIVVAIILYYYLYFDMPVAETAELKSYSCNVYSVKNRFASIREYRKLDKIEIEISEENLKILYEVREKAIKRNILLKRYNKKVNAIIYFKGKKYPCKIRIKGKYRDHWKRPVIWSYKVELGNNKLIKGKNSFALVRSKSRGLINEWVFHKLLQEENVLNVGYDFIALKMNGLALGIYGFEGRFGTDFEINNSTFGTIIKFDTEEFWEKLNDNFTLKEKEQLFFKVYENAPITPYTTKSIYNKNAINLLNSFRNKSLKTSQVFDVEAFSKYLAVITLLGNSHPFNLINLRFYYNPNSNLLEPIGYDLERIHELKKENHHFEADWLWENTSITNQHPFVVTVFSDTLFRKKYFTALKNISDVKKIQNFFKKNSSDIERFEMVLQLELPGYSFEYKKNTILLNCERINQKLKLIGKL